MLHGHLLLLPPSVIVAVVFINMTISLLFDKKLDVREGGHIRCQEH